MPLCRLSLSIFPSVSATLMAPSAEIVETKTELQSIEQLDTQLHLALDTATATAHVLGLSSTPSWSFVVKGTQKLSLPLYDPFGSGGNDIPLSNFFSLLAKLLSEPVCPLLHVEQLRSESAPLPPASPHTSSLSSSFSAPPGCKRLSLSLLQPPNWSYTLSAPLSSSPSPLVTAVASGDVISCDDLPDETETVPIGSVVSVTALTGVAIDKLFSLSSKLSVYNSGCKDKKPETLVIGDLIICSVEPPATKVADIIELFAVLINLHPSAHILIAPVSTYDVMNKQSIKLCDQLVSSHYNPELE